jgi:hypothetical protein
MFDFFLNQTIIEYKSILCINSPPFSAHNSTLHGHSLKLYFEFLRLLMMLQSSYYAVLVLQH